MQYLVYTHYGHMIFIIQLFGKFCEIYSKCINISRWKDLNSAVFLVVSKAIGVKITLDFVVNHE